MTCGIEDCGDVFSVGEDIEVNGFRGDEKLCFYAGIVRCMHRRYFCEIYRPDGEEDEEYVFSLRCNVRPSQQWCLKDGASVWKHRRLVRPAAVGF
ncbi:hypothetical protein LXL04_023295 [Taraxacum kok-saghyz]